MKRFYASLVYKSLVYKSLAIAAVMVVVLAMRGSAHAAPPTVTPSPGYDARLQEQRAAPTVYQPGAHERRRISRRRVKHAH